MDGRLLRATSRLLSFALSSNVEQSWGRHQITAAKMGWIWVLHPVWDFEQKWGTELPVSPLNTWLMRLLHNEDLSWEICPPKAPASSRTVGGLAAGLLHPAASLCIPSAKQMWVWRVSPMEKRDGNASASAFHVPEWMVSYLASSFNHHLASWLLLNFWRELQISLLSIRIWWRLAGMRVFKVRY